MNYLWGSLSHNSSERGDSVQMLHIGSESYCFIIKKYVCGCYFRLRFETFFFQEQII